MLFLSLWRDNSSGLVFSTPLREREKRALYEAEKEFGIPGKFIDWSTYLQQFVNP